MAEQFVGQGFTQNMFIPVDGTVAHFQDIQLQVHTLERVPVSSQPGAFYFEDHNQQFPLTQQTIALEHQANAGWLHTSLGTKSMEFPRLDAYHSSVNIENIGQCGSVYGNSHSSESSLSPSSPDTSQSHLSKDSSSSMKLSLPGDTHGYTYSNKPRKNYEGKVKRSRMGCLACRHRKKRCCETKPRCAECSRLGLNCTWPVPGSEYRNKPKHVRLTDEMHYDPFHGSIRILRGVVEHRAGAS